MIGHFQPQQAPGPGHDPPDVISSAANGYPAPAAVCMSEAVQNGGHFVINFHAAVHMGERIERVRITAMLANDKVRLEMLG
ncbi:hypothetical protein D3C77_626120 [compost metagenome]